MCHIKPTVPAPPQISEEYREEAQPRQGLKEQQQNARAQVDLKLSYLDRLHALLSVNPSGMERGNFLDKIYAICSSIEDDLERLDGDS